MRKLVIFIAAFSISTLLSVYLLPPEGIVISACVCAVVSVGFVFLHGKKRVRYFISCIGLAAGFIYFFVYSSVFVYPAQKLSGTEEFSTVRVIGFP